MTADERHKIAALDAYNTALRGTNDRVVAFCAAFDAARAAGASVQAATEAADFARDEAK